MQDHFISLLITDNLLFTVSVNGVFFISNIYFFCRIFFILFHFPLIIVRILPLLNLFFLLIKNS